MSPTSAKNTIKFTLESAEEAINVSELLCSLAKSSPSKPGPIKTGLFNVLDQSGAAPGVSVQAQVTLRGHTLSWGRPKEADLPESDVELCFATVFWNGEKDVALEDLNEKVKLCITFDTKAAAAGWYVALVRAVAFANDTRSNFTAGVYYENSHPLIVPADLNLGELGCFSLRVPSSLAPPEIIERLLRHARQCLSKDVQLDKAEFVLKLYGFEVLFLEDTPVMNNIYFDHIVRSFVLPRLSVVHISELN